MDKHNPVTEHYFEVEIGKWKMKNRNLEMENGCPPSASVIMRKCDRLESQALSVLLLRLFNEIHGGLSSYR